MSVTTLRVPMAPVRFGNYAVALPLVAVQPRREARLGRTYYALVDSGATFTLARFGVAAALGLDPATVRSSMRTIVFAGIDGARAAAWGWQVDLFLGEGDRTQRLLLPDAWVFFTDRALADYDVLLGHHDALERLTFSVQNHAPDPRFVLRFPR